MGCKRQSRCSFLSFSNMWCAYGSSGTSLGFIWQVGKGRQVWCRLVESTLQQLLRDIVISFPVTRPGWDGKVGECRLLLRGKPCSDTSCLRGLTNDAAFTLSDNASINISLSVLPPTMKLHWPQLWLFSIQMPKVPRQRLHLFFTTSVVSQLENLSREKGN